MKPQRIKLAHHLLLSYGLYRKMEVYVKRDKFIQRPHVATYDELIKFHSDDYVQFLSRITPDSANSFTDQMKRCILYFMIVAIGEQTDCPIFDGMYEFCQQYTGASLGK